MLNTRKLYICTRYCTWDCPYKEPHEHPDSIENQLHDYAKRTGCHFCKVVRSYPKFRRVRAMEPDEYQNAISLGFKEDDLIFVTKTSMEKVTGSPTQFLYDRMQKKKSRKSKKAKK